MLRRDELEALARVAARNDLIVISDEIYEHIRFDDRPHLSPASLSGLADRTVTIMGMSKTYNVTGWRVGYVFAKARLAERIRDVSETYYVCAPAPLQHAVIDALRLPSSYYRDLQCGYQRKRDHICATLTRAGLSPIVPEGAIYVMARIPDGGIGSREAAIRLLKCCGVASVPGTAFFRSTLAESFVRFCFAVRDDILDEACQRLALHGTDLQQMLCGSKVAL